MVYINNAGRLGADFISVISCNSEVQDFVGSL